VDPEVAGQPIRQRLQGLFWDLNPPLRRLLRRFKTRLSLARHRARHRRDGAVGPRVDSLPTAAPTSSVPHPAIALVEIDDGPAGVGQTEMSLARDEQHRDTAPYLAHGEDLDRLPAVHLEAMLMAAAAEDLNWVAGGWGAPAPGPFGPSGIVGRDPKTLLATHFLLRRPHETNRSRAQVVGRVLPHITAPENCPDFEPLDDRPAAGPYRLRPDVAHTAVITQPCFPVDVTLAALPSVDGPPTVLFLLPFLAVGGAERLLFDLMDGLRDRYRLLVATTDPHLESLGQTVDRARELTPHVYTLGDWLPRPALGSALRHLIRRWRVESLVSWNGTVLFHDEAAALRRAFPELRIINQLFNHRGGWIEHLSPSFVRAVDTQIAVNTPIAQALTDERGVPEERVATIHHAVGTPEPRDEGRRTALRRSLGVDDDTVVVGTFIRMHPQKRPLDIIRLARRMKAEPVHFFLVGGGPSDTEVDREIERDPPPNLTRWPMETDASPLYDALDLCLMTSDFEGLPVFLLDGLARGIPCVATAVGDIPLLLADGGGRIVDHPGDLDALATAIKSLLDNETRRVEGEKGRASVAARFGLDRYVAAYEAVIFPKTKDDISS
jgi:glycosyltransferase involved in cell wall biosynthesis